MPQDLRCVAPESVIVGWDFSTGGVKCLAFDLNGQTLAEARVPTDLWTAGGVSELNLAQLEGQVRATTRAIAARLRELGRLDHWAAVGISATHHTAGRIDADRVQVRRAILWNDHTLAAYHAKGMERLGGAAAVQKLIGGPWAIRYSLSHLVKDEETLPEADWQRTWRMLSHGSLAAGFLTGNFDVTSVSCAASTGIMNLDSREWSRDMLGALSRPEYRELAWKQLPRIAEQSEPVGPLAGPLCAEVGVAPERAPLVFPTSDDQQAGLVGGGAVDAGQVAVVLGNSAVVNSSADHALLDGTLDVMRLNWGPYLWMRCYNNGAQFLDQVLGDRPDWAALERAGRAVPAGCGGTSVLPFIAPEPSLGVTAPRVQWLPGQPSDAGVRYRASLEALAYLIALGVEAHGQGVRRISVSGGIARSDLMCEVLASVLGRPLERLVSFEGPALGAATTALAALETHRRKAQGVAGDYTVADAVAQLVKFREPVRPNAEWQAAYAKGLEEFRGRLRS